MRTLLTISAVVLIAARAEERPVTLPSTATLPTSTAAVAGSAAGISQTAGKPVYFSSVSTASGTAESVFGDSGNEGATSTATCPAGSVVVGGGFAITAGHRDIRITQSRPNATRTAWVVFGAWYGDNFNGTNYATFNAVATCIK